MRKNLNLYILITVICISISGCGKTGADNSNTYNLTEETPDLSSPDNIQNHDSQTEKPVDKEEDNSAPASTPEITSMSSAKPGIKKEIISAGKDYSDANRLVTFLGLKEYKKIKGETFTDKPKKGNKYLVLFLSIKNNSYEENYINYNYFKSKIDGKNTEHTFLFNDPKNYPAIFTQINPGGHIAGFIAWEVPDAWNTLEITYNGWKDTDNISLTGSFTPKDLDDPVIYNANDYLNNTQS